MDWIKVYETPDNFKAQLVIALLRKADIESSTMDKKDSMYVMLGTIEIYVHNKDVERAKELLDSLDEQE